MATIKQPLIVEEKEKHDLIIKAIKSSNTHGHKHRLFLDVDGTLVAMKFNPNWKDAKHWWDHENETTRQRTDFCHWLNSVYKVLDYNCEVYVLTNYTLEEEKAEKVRWIDDNLKCKHTLILNKEGISKALYVQGPNDILVDDTFRNLIEWDAAGGTQFASQWVMCEKGRRELMEKIIKE